jgi:hypothetical protein
MARACDWERGVVMNDVYLTWLRALRGEDVAAELDAAVRRAATLGDAESESAGRAFLAQLAANA